jgi:uncharacterized repeat protein (TIGR03803 family)
VALGMAGAALLGFTASGAPAATLVVLYSFNGADGSQPTGGAFVDRNGAVYGTTSGGGITGGACGTAGCGTVFKLVPPKPGQTAWTRQSYQFRGSDGADPRGGVFVDASGAIYGTTFSGGANNLGTVFKLTPLDAAQATYAFAGYSFSGSDGANPQGGVFVDGGGAVYGTTSAGGTSGQGTAFKLTPPSAGGAYTPQSYSFGGGSDGATPLGSVFVDGNGALYGTTSAGGAGGFGTVFKFTPLGASQPGYTIATYDFASPEDGETPFAGVITDGSGIVYGTTFDGGAQAFGTVFSLTPGPGNSGFSKGTFSFGGASGDPTLGVSPSGGLIIDQGGALYGTTLLGGTGLCKPVPTGNFGCGAIFKLSPPGSGQTGYSESVLYSFTGGTDGSTPAGNLAIGHDGAIYGTATDGGQGFGVVFQLTP